MEMFIIVIFMPSDGKFMEKVDLIFPHKTKTKN